MKYPYFVSYMWTSKTESGSGCIEMIMDRPIEFFDDIMEIIKYLNINIKDSKGTPASCTVINYKQLKGPYIK